MVRFLFLASVAFAVLSSVNAKTNTAQITNIQVKSISSTYNSSQQASSRGMLAIQ